MSKEKNFELSIVKMAKDINYEKPNHPNNLVDKEEYKKIDMAIATSVALTNAGTTLVLKMHCQSFYLKQRKILCI